MFTGTLLIVVGVLQLLTASSRRRRNEGFLIAFGGYLLFMIGYSDDRIAKLEKQFETSPIQKQEMAP